MKTQYEQLKETLKNWLEVDLIPFFEPEVILGERKEYREEAIKEFLSGRVETYLTYDYEIEEFLKHFDRRDNYKLVENRKITVDLWSFEEAKRIYARDLCDAIFLKIGEELLKEGLLRRFGYIDE